MKNSWVAKQKKENNPQQFYPKKKVKLEEEEKEVSCVWIYVFILNKNFFNGV